MIIMKHAMSLIRPMIRKLTISTMKPVRTMMKPVMIIMQLEMVIM